MMNKQQLIIPYINNNDRVNNGAKRKWKVENMHHPVPKCRLEEWSREELVALFMDFHTAYHRVFGNAVFQEQLHQLLKINDSVLSDGYKKDLKEVISMEDNYIYKNGIYVKR